MSLLSLPDEILLNYIFSCQNITTTDLFRLMLSCSRLRNVIVDSNNLWMSKCSPRWIQMHNQSPEKKKVVWKDWVFSQRVIEEVQNAATNLSSQCYPFGKLVAPLHGVEDWIIGSGYPDFVFAEDELRDLIFTESINANMTLSHYASVALERLKICLQLRNINNFLAKPESQKTLLEGAKVISKWFHCNGYGVNDNRKLTDNVEQSLDECAEGVKKMVEETNSEAPEDILKCIYEFVTSKMRLYRKDALRDSSTTSCFHSAASIHMSMSKGVVYPEVLTLIYLEMATRIGIGITCQPIRTPLSKNPILICKFEGGQEFYIDPSLQGGFLPPDHQPMIDQPACSVEDFFEPMIKSLFSDDIERYLNRPDRSTVRCLRSSLQLLCSLWPTKAKVIKSVQECIEIQDLVEDAHRFLQLAKVEKDETVMIKCKDQLLSQQTEINDAKVARHRWHSITDINPSIKDIRYAVGRVVHHSRLDAHRRHIRDIPCVILSFDKCFRAEVSQRKWGFFFESVTNGYSLDQPYYHVISAYGWDEPMKYLYVPQESLHLFHGSVSSMYHDGFGIYFERYDGRRYVPNAEHKAHFPDE